MFNKVDKFIRIFGGTKYLALFGPEIYDTIFDRISYLIGLKKRYYLYYFSQNDAKKTISLDDDLTLKKKTLTFHKFVILVKLVFNKNHNQYYYNTFSEKCSYHLVKK